MTRYGMVIDVTRCDGCYNCFIACKDEYCEQAQPGYSAAQPMTGQDWMRIIAQGARPVPQGQAGLHRDALHAVRGRRLRAAGADGAVYKRDDGIVMIDPEKADGPEGARHQVPLPQDLLERGRAGRAEVHVLRPPAGRRLERAPLRGGLPHRRSALRRPGRSRQRRVQGAGRQAEAMHPEYSLGEKVRYIGLPKNFVAGAVVFGDTDECAKGATVTLDGRRRHGDHARPTASATSSSRACRRQRDYTVTVAALRATRVSSSRSRTTRSIYLGDIVLETSYGRRV